MNALQILVMLAQMGVCQVATLEDASGQQVRAFVCAPQPVAAPSEDDDTVPKINRSKPNT